MLDVSFWELLIIGAIALVVVGPERLPRLMRTLGLWAGRARASFQSVRDEVEREVNMDGVRETRRAIDRETAEARRRVTDAVTPVNDEGHRGGGEAPARTETDGDGSR